MAVIVTGSISRANIGYANLFTNPGAQITASSETAGYEKENAYDFKQYDWWKPASTGTEWIRVSLLYAHRASYMGIWGHNLGETSGSVKAQYSTNGGVTWNDATSAVAPATGRTLYIKFNAVSAADWRCLVVTKTGKAAIAGVQFGEALVLDTGMKSGFAPPTLSPEVESKTAMSERGVNLGVSTLRAWIKGKISINNLDPGWVRSDLQPLIDHLASGKPAIMSWDPTLHGDEACLFWVTKQINPPSYQDPLYMQASIDFEGTE